MTAGTRPPPPRARAVPVWQPLEWPKEGLAAIPGVALGPDPVRGRMIAVRATPGAREGGWAARAAVEIARAGAAQGARVLLADLFVNEPHLHEVFGAHNLEGVTDAVVYGASVGRIARAADEGAFRVATAGTPVADARALFDDPGWRRLVEGLVGEGITLVAYQPAETVVPPRGPSIVLARKGEPMTALGPTGLKDAVAVRGPRQGPAAARAAADGGAIILGELGYRPSPWDEAGDDAASGAVVEATRMPEPEMDDQAAAGAEPAAGAAPPPTPVDGDPSVAPGAAPPPPSTRAGAEEDTARDAAPRPGGRGLSASAFVVLVLFASVMILMGINNAGIAEVPGADRLWALFEGLLARISQLFVR